MVEIADLRDCAPSGLFYGGRAGQKEGILIAFRLPTTRGFESARFAA